MRAIAEELGNAPMALYRHVADRQALVAGMLDAVMAEIVPPEPSDNPREEIIGLCSAVYRALRRDGWAVLVQVVDGVASPVTLPLLERLYAALRAAGLSDADCHRAVAALRHHTYGVLLGTHRTGWTASPAGWSGTPTRTGTRLSPRPPGRRTHIGSRAPSSSGWRSW
jgi:AcrR family transcriptional regulator